MKTKAVLDNDSVFEIMVHQHNASNDVRFLTKLEGNESGSFCNITVHIGAGEFFKYGTYGGIKNYANLLSEKEWGLIDEDIDWDSEEEFEQYLKKYRGE